MSKEIELKFSINTEIKSKIIAELEKTVEKCGENHLVDTYYVPYFKDYEVNGETNECLRIRETDNKIVLSYKKIHRECSPVYCDEYETKISSKDEMEKVLFAIGFSVQMIIDKTRITYKMDKYEFAFDSVKNLGELMEVELTDPNGNIEDIYSFLKQFGLTEKDVTYEGIQMMMKKKLAEK